MEESPEEDDINLTQALKDIDERMNQFSSILEKFGMDLITKIGKLNNTIKMLIDKVNNLDKATLDVKSLKPKLNNIIENQKSLDSELELVKSLMQKSTTRAPVKSSSEVEVKNEKELRTIDQQFNNLKRDLDSQDTSSIKKDLETLKQNIFEQSGGNKILYDISKVIKELKDMDTISEEFKTQIRQKIEMWEGNL
ncbi:MAG: hypothetical protein BAJALOKI2v1_150041 [Promethearchaeota archaeon]|nr:MAG: hypothetical protein BAJALOKI2v1_150041 [Candidatus Lokiarchaeota archaeon]